MTYCSREDDWLWRVIFSVTIAQIDANFVSACSLITHLFSYLFSFCFFLFFSVGVVSRSHTINHFYKYRLYRLSRGFWLWACAKGGDWGLEPSPRSMSGTENFDFVHFSALSFIFQNGENKCEYWQIEVSEELQLFSLILIIIENDNAIL